MVFENPQVKEMFDNYSVKLDKSINSYVYELNDLKVGRANPHLVEKIMVDYYGVQTPISQVGNISIPEARLLVISVWDKSMLTVVEKAIIAANIGINPTNDGKVIRLNFPELTEERRKDLVKVLKSLTENCKVVLRNVRRDINDSLKKMKKDISEDQIKTYEAEVDKILNKKIEEVDQLYKNKEKEILSV